MLLIRSAGFAAGVELSLDDVSPVASLLRFPMVVARVDLACARSITRCRRWLDGLNALMVCEEDGWVDGDGKVDEMDGLRSTTSKLALNPFKD